MANHPDFLTWVQEHFQGELAAFQKFVDRLRIGGSSCIREGGDGGGDGMVGDGGGDGQDGRGNMGRQGHQREWEPEGTAREAEGPWA